MFDEFWQVLEVPVFTRSLFMPICHVDKNCKNNWPVAKTFSYHFHFFAKVFLLSPFFLGHVVSISNKLCCGMHLSHHLGQGKLELSSRGCVRQTWRQKEANINISMQIVLFDEKRCCHFMAVFRWKSLFNQLVCILVSIEKWHI